MDEVQHVMEQLAELARWQKRDVLALLGAELAEWDAQNAANKVDLDTHLRLAFGRMDARCQAEREARLEKAREARARTRLWKQAAAIHAATPRDENGVPVGAHDDRMSVEEQQLTQGGCIPSAA
jgi:hypothetical protein